MKQERVTCIVYMSRSMHYNLITPFLASGKVFEVSTPSRRTCARPEPSQAK
jgi:hypothetical protein